MSTFDLPSRPPALPVFKTCIYKTVGELSIKVDLYLPPPGNAKFYKIALFIHGGGWTGSNRTDYSRPLFHRFLSLSFIVASMDYRLLPETGFKGQLEDIRDIEPWLRTALPSELGETSSHFNVSNIIVVGASAGALLALLTVRASALPVRSRSLMSSLAQPLDNNTNSHPITVRTNQHALPTLPPSGPAFNSQAPTMYSRIDRIGV